MSNLVTFFTLLLVLNHHKRDEMLRIGYEQDKKMNM